jgi:UDP-glucose 4-epimerase
VIITHGSTKRDTDLTPYHSDISTFSGPDRLVEQATSGGPITVDGDGQQTRDFVFVDDVVQANLRAAVTDATGVGYNIGTGSNVTIRELAETVRGLVDESVDIVHTDPRPGDIEQSEADITRARERLGYSPTVSLEDGLSELI